MINSIHRIVKQVSDTPVSVALWVSAFLGVVALRYFLEIFSSPSLDGAILVTGPSLLHVGLFFLGSVFLSIVVAHKIAGIPLLQLTRSVLFVLPIMWLAPVIDIPMGGAHMAYLFNLEPSTAVSYFFQYFGPFTLTPEITIGQRIELGLLIALFGGYVYLQTRRLVAAVGVMIGQYVLLFVLAILPSIIAWMLPNGDFFATLPSTLLARSFTYGVDLNNVTYILERLFDVAMAQLFYLVFCISFLYWGRRAVSNVYEAVVSNLRYERMFHFGLMVVLGVLLAISSGAAISWYVFDVITFGVTAFVVLFACLFAIVLNDLVDEPIDRVSNTERPLVTGQLGKKEMHDLALVFGLLMAVGASTLGLHAFGWVSIFTASYYVYSVPPLRLKRIPLFSSLLIGVASLAFLLLGFYLMMPTRSLAVFPGIIGVLLVVSMTLITNVRDLKDVEGDAAAGIKTIPTLLGDVRARQVMSIMTAAAYVLVPILIPVTLLWLPSLLAAVLSAYALLSGKGEKPIFIIYFCYIAFLVAVLARV